MCALATARSHVATNLPVRCDDARKRVWNRAATTLLPYYTLDANGETFARRLFCMEIGVRCPVVLVYSISDASLCRRAKPKAAGRPCSHDRARETCLGGVERKGYLCTLSPPNTEVGLAWPGRKWMHVRTCLLLAAPMPRPRCLVILLPHATAGRRKRLLIWRNARLASWLEQSIRSSLGARLSM